MVVVCVPLLSSRLVNGRNHMRWNNFFFPFFVFLKGKRKRKQVEPLRFSLSLSLPDCVTRCSGGKKKSSTFSRTTQQVHTAAKLYRKKTKTKTKQKLPKWATRGFSGVVPGIFSSRLFSNVSKGCFWKTIHALALLNSSSSTSPNVSSSGGLKGERKRERARDFLGISYVSDRLLN